MPTGSTLAAAAALLALLALLPSASIATTPGPAAGSSTPAISVPGQAITSVVVDADGARTLIQSIVVDAELPEVWRALTTSEGWRGWAAPVAWVDFRLDGIIETSYRRSAQAGDPANIRNRVIAYLPMRMFAIRNVQAPPNAGFDVPTFQSLHTVVMLDATGPRSTRVTFAQPGYRSGEAFDGVFRHFAAGNGWTLEQLRKRFIDGPVDWDKRAAEAAAAVRK
jgi:uncharacterized protein YndB with AHSA1/START domain